MVKIDKKNNKTNRFNIRTTPYNTRSREKLIKELSETKNMLQGTKQVNSTLFRIIREDMIKQGVEKLRREIITHRNKIIGLCAENLTLEAERNSFEKRSFYIENENQKLRTTNNELNNKVIQLENENQELKHKLQHIESLYDANNEMIISKDRIIYNLINNAMAYRLCSYHFERCYKKYSEYFNDSVCDLMRATDDELGSVIADIEERDHLADQLMLDIFSSVEEYMKEWETVGKDEMIRRQQERNQLN